MACKIKVMKALCDSAPEAKAKQVTDTADAVIHAAQEQGLAAAQEGAPQKCVTVIADAAQLDSYLEVAQRLPARLERLGFAGTHATGKPAAGYGTCTHPNEVSRIGPFSYFVVLEPKAEPKSGD